MTPEQNEREYIKVLPKYKAIKKKLGLNDEDLAIFYGYKNLASFSNAKDGRKKTIIGFVRTYEAIINHLKLDQ